MDPPGTTRDFIVGPWYVRPSMNMIARDGRTVQLEPKVMQMLVILAERAGEVVSRNDLHERLWTDTIVTDKALTRLASELRKAFGDDPREPRIIATISKSGYRLLAPISVVSPGDGSPPVTDSRDLFVQTVPPARSHRPRRLQTALLAVTASLITGGIAGMLLFPQHSTFEPAIQVTTYPGHEISPALSPDGNEIAFSWRGIDDSNWDIYVKQPGSDGLLRLTDDPGDDLHPTWSPDGTKIAFLRYDSRECSIIWTPALSGPLRKLGSCGWVDEEDRPYRTSSIDWSPDGRSIAASDHGIFLIDVESGSRQVVTDPPLTVIVDANPSFSPDGSSIAFMRVRPLASSDLFLVSTTGFEETRLTDEARLILGHAWSRDGHSLFFSSNRGGRFGLWRIAASGGTPVAVPADGWNIEKVSVARHGTRMAYEGWVYDTNIWLLSTQGISPPARIVASTMWDRDPAFSPDGDRIAFISNRSGNWELWIGNTDGSAQSMLTDFGGLVVGVPRWSPDCTRIAFQAQGASRSEIRVIDVETRVAHAAGGDEGDDGAPAWSQDGKNLYFGSSRSGTWQIWTAPAQGGEARQVTQRGGYAAAAGPDGKTLYYSRHDSSGIWVTSLDGSTEERILDQPAGSDWGNWAVTNAGLFVLERPLNAPPTLRQYDFNGHIVGDVMSLERAPSPHHPGLSLSPDGQSLLVTLVDATDSDLFVMATPD